MGRQERLQRKARKAAEKTARRTGWTAPANWVDPVTGQPVYPQAGPQQQAPGGFPTAEPSGVLVNRYLSAPPTWVPPQPQVTRPPLRRATAQSADMPTPWLAGVCSGLSIHLGIPVQAVRAIAVVLGLMAGLGVFLYLWLLVQVPVDDGASTGDGRLAPAQTRVARDRSRITARNQILFAGFAVLAVALIVYLAFRTDAIRIRDLMGIPLILAGMVLVWAQGSRVRQWRSPLVMAAIGGGLILLITGIIMLSGRSDSPTAMLRGGAIGALIVLGIVVALAPLWVRFNRELTAAAREKVRDQERADIAAHLHDSVLQTLTLIRGAADDPARVRALALTQERELRSWLYTGHEEAADSLAQAMRDAIGAVESTYGQAIDVVTVGDMRPGPGELALVAAAAEACTNAMRHAAPPVSVYMEVSAGGVEAWVKDSGPGFDLDDVPDDRHGVRNSIIGRMERAGGTAEILPRATGTEWHLHMPTQPADGEAEAATWGGDATMTDDTTGGHASGRVED